MKRLSILIILFITLFTINIKAEANNKYIIDSANLLSADFESSLNHVINEFIEKHNSDLVIITTTSLEGKTPRQYADDFYDYNGYKEDGALLLISIEENDIYISTSGLGIYAFTDFGKDKALDDIVLNLSIGNFEKGVETFVSIANEYFTLAENGTPFDRDSVPTSIGEYVLTIIVIWVVSLIISLFIVNSMKAKHITIRAQTNANNYISNRKIDLINSSDIYLYRTVTRTRIPQNSSGSSTHRGSSGRTHGGGGRKF